MFWMSLVMSAFAFVFIKLGAYSAWISILSGGFKFALFLIACLVFALIGKKRVDNKN